MNAMVNGSPEAFTQHTSFLDTEEKNQLTHFLETENFAEAMKDFSKEDYALFKKVMKETFLIFPEGSRSYIDPDGSVVMKYINPKYLQSYMRARRLYCPHQPGGWIRGLPGDGTCVQQR